MNIDNVTKAREAIEVLADSIKLIKREIRQVEMAILDLLLTLNDEVDEGIRDLKKYNICDIKRERNIFENDRGNDEV